MIAMDIVRVSMKYLGGKVGEFINYEVLHIKTDDVNVVRIVRGSAEVRGCPPRTSILMTQ